MLLAFVCFPLLLYLHGSFTIANELVDALVSETRTKLPTIYHINLNSSFCVSARRLRHQFFFGSCPSKNYFTLSELSLHMGNICIRIFSILTGPGAFCLEYHFRGEALSVSSFCFLTKTYQPSLVKILTGIPRRTRTAISALKGRCHSPIRRWGHIQDTYNTVLYQLSYPSTGGGSWT